MNEIVLHSQITLQKIISIYQPFQPLLVFMTVTNDSLLVDRCLNRERKAYEELLDRYESPIFNVAYRILNDYDDAADVTQSVFIKAYEKLHTYNAKYKLFSWLYRIAINESLNYLNQRKKTVPIDDTLTNDERDICDTLDDQITNTMIQKALMQLSIEYRTVITLYHFQNLSYKEMSFVLSIPEKTVKSRLFSARTLLRELMKREGM